MNTGPYVLAGIVILIAILVAGIICWIKKQNIR